MSLGTETIIFDELTADPSSPEAGEVWFRTDLDRFRYYDGATVYQFSTLAELQAHISDVANPHSTTLELARQAGDTFAGNVNMGNNELLNVATATLVTSAPNLQQVRDEITQAIQNDAWHDPVIDTLNTPPGAPVLGDRYLIGTAPTGAWAANADYITEWNGSSWDFFGPPEAGWITYDESVPQFVQYNGTAWAPFGTAVDHGSLLGLLDDDHPQYLLVDGTRAMSGNLDMGGNDVAKCWARRRRRRKRPRSPARERRRRSDRRRRSRYHVCPDELHAGYLAAGGHRARRAHCASGRHRQRSRRDGPADQGRPRAERGLHRDAARGCRDIHDAVRRCDLHDHDGRDQ